MSTRYWIPAQRETEILLHEDNRVEITQHDDVLGEVSIYFHPLLLEEAVDYLQQLVTRVKAER